MARLRSLEYGVVWIHSILADPDPGDPARNGRYRGPLRVREIAPGASGRDATSNRLAPARGQLWRLGPVLVRIIVATSATVRFLELNFMGNTRSMRRCDFLRRARLQARA